MALTWCKMRYIRKNVMSICHRNRHLCHFRQCRRTFALSSFILNKQRSQGTPDRSENTASAIPTKKDTSGPLPKAYDPRYVEKDWYEWWEASGFFSPDHQTGRASHTSPRDAFVVCLPPPNVTGTLHLGHALGNSIQDAITRWHRMRGHEALWVPGSDHAGIATQVIVEKQLWRERGLTRHDLGRQDFIQHVWEWKAKKGDVIHQQMRKLGSSLDWDRECFTLDPKLSHAVTEAFIRLHDAGIIYRSNRLVNWSCALKSAISDIEVEDVELSGKTYLSVPGYEEKVPFGTLTSFKYPLQNSKETVTIATTRPETMLGDMAIAVHPGDTRYQHLHGHRVVHPFSGKFLPIVCDEFVSMEFGTGVVKITPAHDPRDYEVGQRHLLETVNILSEDGRLTNVPEDFMDLPRFMARERVIQGLQDKGLLVDIQDHPMSLPVCSRSQDVIEPFLKDQWFVDCKDMAAHAIQAVETGDLELFPPQYERNWNEWLENIRDWCISRQLWWGHQIPAYRVFHKDGQNGEDLVMWVSAHSMAEATLKASEKLQTPPEDLHLVQDEDVLDTWFSSALYPFSVFGWPNQTFDLSRFYPTSLLETASDIMFFWVARMVMLGQRLTGQLPFKQVLFHSILRDSYGRKMSKSIGNVIDPMDVIHGITLQELQSKVAEGNLSAEEVSKARQAQVTDYPEGIPQCGADALRFTLCSYNYKATHVNIDKAQMVNSRHFCNKIWQAFSLVKTTLGEDFQVPDQSRLEPQTATDAWMLSRLSGLVDACNQGFVNYDLRRATSALYDFWYLDFCGVYLEYSKVILQRDDPSARRSVQDILYLCTVTAIEALAPFMPFLCEELYQRLPGDKAESICLAPYPQVEQFPWRQPQVEGQVTVVRGAVTALLSLRKEFNMTKSKAKVYVRCHSTDVSEALQSHLVVLKTLSRSQSVDFLSQDGATPEGSAVVEGEGYTAFVELQGVLDIKKELERVAKQLRKLDKDLERVSKQTNREAGIPEHIVLAAETKIEDMESKRKRLISTRNMLFELER